MSRLGALRGVLALVACLCTGCADPAPPSPAPAPAPAPALRTPELRAAPQMRVYHPSQLPADLSVVESLDLALSESDRGLAGAQASAEHPCDALDLPALVQRTPRLRALRISGCQARWDLQALSTSKLERLTLAQAELDAAAAAAVAAGAPWRQLTLEQIQLTQAGVEALTGQTITNLALIDVQGPAAGLLRAVGVGLRGLTLEGAFVDHNLVLRVDQARGLTALSLRSPTVGNYSLSALAALPELRELKLSGPRFGDATPLYLRRLQLEQFTCDCPSLGDTGIRHLRWLGALTALRLPQSAVEGEAIAELDRLKALRELVIPDATLDAEALAALGHTPLERLDVEAIAAGAGAGLVPLASLRSLRLRGQVFDPTLVAGIASLPAIEHLDLRRSNLDDRGLSQLGVLNELREIQLAHTRVTHRGLAALSELPNLQDVDLSFTDVVDGGVRAIGAPPKLRSLNLQRTLVTDQVREPLEQMPALRHVDLRGTVATAETAAALRASGRTVLWVARE